MHQRRLLKKVFVRYGSLEPGKRIEATASVVTSDVLTSDLVF